MTTPSSLSHLSPDQRSALYDRARREAAELRRQAMRDATSALASAVRAVWLRAVHALVAPPSQGAPACPR